MTEVMGCRASRWFFTTGANLPSVVVAARQRQRRSKELLYYEKDKFIHFCLGLEILGLLVPRIVDLLVPRNSYMY